MTQLLQAPPTRLESWLLSLDPDHLAAIISGFIVILFVLCMIPSIVARTGRTEAPAATRPASSNRKAGRTRATGGPR